MMTAVQELKPKTLDRKECIATSATPDPPIEIGMIAIVETPNETTIEERRSIFGPVFIRITQSANPRRRASTSVRARAFMIIGNASCFSIDRAESENVLVA